MNTLATTIVDELVSGTELESKASDETTFFAADWANAVGGQFNTFAKTAADGINNLMGTTLSGVILYSFWH